MKALILNSGLGKRMGAYTENCPKCMVEIAENETIVSRQLRMLREVGIDEVVMTTGPYKELLEEYVLKNSVGMKIQFVNNPIYDSTNYIYSMYLARTVLDDDIVLMHGDLVFEGSVLKDVLCSEKSCMTVSDKIALPEKDFKAVIEEGKIKAVGVEYMDKSVAAQPIYHMKKKDFAIWMKLIVEFCENGVRSCYAENALNQVLNDIELGMINYGLRLCQEIDREEDLIDTKKKLLKL